MWLSVASVSLRCLGVFAALFEQLALMCKNDGVLYGEDLLLDAWDLRGFWGLACCSAFTVENPRTKAETSSAR